MKSLCPTTLLLAIAMTACQSGNTSETATDSTNVMATDSLSAQSTAVTPYISAPAAPPVISNLPSYTGDIYTDDKNEQKVTEKLNELLDVYDKMPLLKVSRYFDREYEEPSDYDDTNMVHESETETWYYDSANHLRAYSIESGYRFSESIYTSKKSIYLYAGDSLVGFYEDEDISLEMSSTRRSRAVMALCPACGVYITDNTGMEFSASVLDESSISSGTSYLVSETGMLDLDVSETPRSDVAYGTDYIFNGEVTTTTSSSPTVPVTYSVQYTIDAYLFDRFMQPQQEEEEGD